MLHVNWPKKMREWVHIPTPQAVQMCKLIVVELQSIYQRKCRLINKVVKLVGH